MSEMLIPFIEDVTPSIYKSMPGIRAMGLDVGATNVNLTQTNNVITPTNTPFAGYLLKQMTRVNLDRLTFPKIYKPANTKCQVDVCGNAVSSAPPASVSTQSITLQGGSAVKESFEVISGNVISGWTCSTPGSGGSIATATDWVTQGTYSAKFTTGSTATGITASKSFDLSGLSGLYIDINVVSLGGLATTLKIDGVTKISKTGGASIYLNEYVDLSAYSGLHTIELAAPIANAVIVSFDNLRFVYPAPSATTDFYKDDSIVVTSGTGTGQTRKITAYDGTTKVATLDEAWTTTPTTASGFVLYDGIASNISPGFDFSTIDYTVNPTVNVICSLEKQAGATASPSMGVPVVTSIEKDWESQAPVLSTNATTSYTTALSVIGRCRLDSVSSFTTAAGGIPWIRVTIDGTVVFSDLVVGLTGAASQLDFVLKREAQNTLLVEHKSAGAFSSTIAVSYSK